MRPTAPWKAPYQSTTCDACLPAFQAHHGTILSQSMGAWHDRGTVAETALCCGLTAQHEVATILDGSNICRCFCARSHRSPAPYGSSWNDRFAAGGSCRLTGTFEPNRADDFADAVRARAESRRMCGAALGPVTHFPTPCHGSSAGDPRAREAASRRRPEPAWQAPMRQWSPLQWSCCPEL